VHDYEEISPRRGGKRRFDDEYEPASRRVEHLPDVDDATDGLPVGDRWSTWDQSTPTQKGPKPYPKWLVTDLAAVDTELGIMKTGKEADVYLIRRGVPGTAHECLLAAKRYRDSEHRMFHRDSGYLEGRKSRESRVNRATAKRTAFGREAIAGQWADAEFNALSRLHSAGVPVPYPVQILGTELLLEFIGDPDGTAAPRLAETRPSPDELQSLWSQVVAALSALATLGYAHADASPYNMLVHSDARTQGGRLVLIDLPQVVDVISHPNGRSYLSRDAANLAKWFTARGLEPPAETPAPEELAGHLLAEAGLA
jgi:RIO kinase 1